MQYLVLCTDDPYFATVVPHLFEGHFVQIVPKNQLISALHFSVLCSYCIIEFSALHEEDWNLLEVIKMSPVSTYIMVRREITKDEVLRAQKAGVTGVLIDPLAKWTRHQGQDIQDILVELTYQVGAESAIEKTVLIGYDTYFHTEKHTISRWGEQTQLSNRETDMLKLFLHHEGKILTKEKIANELWGGVVASGGIPKLVGRLRNKLGVAGTLINGRNQGGYIYEKDHPVMVTLLR